MPLNKSKGNMYSWMAGFIDGEAWIGISKQIRKIRPTPTYRAILAIPNQQRKSLEVFQKEFGGNIRVEKDCYRWHCPRKQLEKMLKKILPFLVLKRKQCLLLLDFLSQVKSEYGCKPLKKESIDIRERFYRKMKILNKHTFWEEINAFK